MSTIDLSRISAIKIMEGSQVPEWMSPDTTAQLAKNSEFSWIPQHTTIQELKDKNLMEGIEIRSLYKDCYLVSKNH